MTQQKKIALLLLSIFITLLFTSCISASERIENVELKPKEIVFMYSDENTTTYKGDLGLLGASVRNEIDNKTYNLDPSDVRGIAKLTKKSFKLNDSLFITADNSGYDYKRNYCDYNAFMIKFRNGSNLRRLSIGDDELTADDKLYFDDYEMQKAEYYEKQHDLDERSAAVDESYKIKNSKKSSSGYFVGTRGSGYYHSF